MAWLNEEVLGTEGDLFCTACYGTLVNGVDGWRLESTAAGHPLPILATTRGTWTVGQPGSLLGVLESLTTVTETSELEPGDVVVFYTDGITDLPPPYGISTDELIELVQKLRHSQTAEEVADAIHRSLLDRVPDRSRQDDVALLVLRVD